MKQNTLIIELRKLHQDERLKKCHNSNLKPSKTTLQSSILNMNAETKEGATTKYESTISNLTWGYKSIECATILTPKNYIELQTSFAIAFPHHDDLVIVETTDGRQILPNEENDFSIYDRLIFREFRPGYLHEKGLDMVMGLSECWENKVYDANIRGMNAFDGNCKLP